MTNDYLIALDPAVGLTPQELIAAWQLRAAAGVSPCRSDWLGQETGQSRAVNFTDRKQPFWVHTHRLAANKPGGNPSAAYCDKRGSALLACLRLSPSSPIDNP
jgi:hypothetical protein